MDSRVDSLVEIGRKFSLVVLLDKLSLSIGAREAVVLLGRYRVVRERTRMRRLVPTDSCLLLLIRKKFRKTLGREGKNSGDLGP
jgi:hypothetical protein